MESGSTGRQLVLVRHATLLPEPDSRAEATGSLVILKVEEV